MSATTIRTDEELTTRVAAAAERAGKSSLAFIVDTLAETVERSEMDETLHRIADERWAMLCRTGETVGWDDVKAYARSRAVDKETPQPSMRKPAR